MSDDQMYRKLRFLAGNAIRFATIPWKEHRVTPDEATTIFGSSFGANGWHHLRCTLQQIDANPAIDWRETALCRYLSEFSPRSVSDLVPWPASEPRLPLFVYPWGTFRKGELDSPKSAARSRFCGPSTPEFIADEFTRTVALYRRMRVEGYRPWSYANTFIGGTLLLRSDGQRRFVVLQGNHRMAILAHLGMSGIAVRDVRGFEAVIRERDLSRWPLVERGVCSPEAARAVFDLFFTENGYHILDGLNKGRHVPVQA